MHLKSLQLFCDVVRLRSFSKAAGLNGVSQSGASQAVHHLEERLGVQLIDRSRRPFVLTSEGKRYHEGCESLLRQYNELENEIRSVRDVAASRITIASIYSVGLAHMSQHLREFATVCPQAEVQLEYLPPHRVAEVVESGQVDLGIVSYPADTRALVATHWRNEPMVIVAPPEHPLAKRSKAPLEALHGERFITFQKGLRIREEIDRALAIRNIEVRSAFAFDNIETMKRAVEIGSGLSLLPEPTIAREVAAGTLVSIRLAGQQLNRPLGLVHRRDGKLSSTAKDFMAFLRSRSSDSDEGVPPAINNGAISNSKPIPETMQV